MTIIKLHQRRPVRWSIVRLGNHEEKKQREGKGEGEDTHRYPSLVLWCQCITSRCRLFQQVASFVRTAVHDNRDLHRKWQCVLVLDYYNAVIPKAFSTIHMHSILFCHPCALFVCMCVREGIETLGWFYTHRRTSFQTSGIKTINDI